MTAVNEKLINFASLIEHGTLQQARETSEMPFIWPYMAIMPDAHYGNGATVGSVIPTVGAIIPSAVGVDIGCGMIALQTQFSYDDLPHSANLRELHTMISNAIPSSMGTQNDKIRKTAQARILDLEKTMGSSQAELAKPNWRQQLGSLGGGNHFIEISLDEADRIWLFLHSGSRGVGLKLANKWIKVAKEYCEMSGAKLPNADLAYLAEGEAAFDGYMEALQWAQKYALLNREEMMDRVVHCFEEFSGKTVIPQQKVNCHHNYTAREQIQGRMVWLSRKGAIDAHEGVMGLIPGSMGDFSYVVRGKGLKLALDSSPHGAGRLMGRKVAKEKLTRDSLDKLMAGIVWGNSDAFIDEHPRAYKPIETVMEDSRDMIKIMHTLMQIVNVKGN